MPEQNVSVVQSGNARFAAQEAVCVLGGGGEE